MIDTNPIGTQRLQNQYLKPDHGLALTALLQKMGPIQAQDYEMMLWAVGLRTALKRASIVKCLAEAKIVRTHLLRPTWHLTTAEQVYDFLALSAPNIKNSLSARHAKLGLDDKTIAQSQNIIRSVLQGRPNQSRAEIKPHLLSAGLDLSENRFYHLLLRAALDGLICGGQPNAKEQTYSLLAECVPPQAPQPEATILQDLAKCYFQTRGPARLKDFSWWAGLKQKQAKQALASILESLEVIQIEGESYYQYEGPTQLVQDERVHFLPAYDEFIIAYQDKLRLLRKPEYLPLIAKSGVFYPMIVHRAWIIGRWKVNQLKEKIRIGYQIFDKQTAPSKAQLQAGIEAYSYFIERPVELYPLD